MAYRDWPQFNTRVPPHIFAAFELFLRRTGRNRSRELIFMLLEHMDAGPRPIPPEIERRMPGPASTGRPPIHGKRSRKKKQ